jgi:hypothetical protein
MMVDFILCRYALSIRCRSFSSIGNGISWRLSALKILRSAEYSAGSFDEFQGDIFLTDAAPGPSMNDMTITTVDRSGIF